MSGNFSLQYEDVASSADWRDNPVELKPEFMAISADSHVTEPPEAYSRYIDPKFRGQTPHVVDNPDTSINNQLYMVEGMGGFPFHTAAAAGMRPQDISLERGGFATMPQAGWDPKHRIAAQDQDGMLAEVLYPTLGMILCGHPDADYKTACFRAYNQWIRDYCAEDPKRLYGVGQTAARSPRDTIEDLMQIKELGLKSVMMPADPGCDDMDYDHPEFDAVWKTSVELELPISFHILTGKVSGQFVAKPPRGGKLAGFNSIMRDLQDITGMFIFGRVFERHPDLRIVLVESDAGWVPHFMSRMDHIYKRHRFWMKSADMAKLPSEYFSEHVYLTFQDDWVALQTTHMMNPDRLMWANDYPHSDSTWPWSHEILGHHLKGLPARQIDRILRENVKELYKLDVETRVSEAAVAH